MQTLGLSDSTPRTESRLQSLFWPSIATGEDVDYLATQGYWVCVLVAALSLIVLSAMGHLGTAVITFLLFFLGGVGVRERSRYAATVVFAAYVLDALAAPAALVSVGGVVRIVFAALLLANVRATWISSGWTPDSEAAALPPRQSESLTDKFSDQLPARIWPKARKAYYVYSAIVLAIYLVGFILIVANVRR